MPRARSRLPPAIAALLAAWVLGAPLATAEEGPRLVVDRTEHDFGTAGQEQELRAEFTYRNDGDAALEGLQAIGDCGCYGVTLSDTELGPGESGTLAVTFRTLMFSGTVKKRLKIRAANLPGKEAEIRLRVDVAAGVILDPGRIWFGDVLLGASPKATVVAKWRKDVGKPFKVTSVEVPGHAFGIEMSPYETEAWQGTSITIAFKSPPALGMFSATALVRTDHPDYPRISVPLTANVTGKVWVQSRTVYFGWMPAGETKSTSIVVKPLDETVTLGEVRVEVRGRRVKAEIVKHERHEGWWRLQVSTLPDAPAGPIEDVIEVRTEVPGEEITEIQVRGEILAHGR